VLSGYWLSKGLSRAGQWFAGSVPNHEWPIAIPARTIVMYADVDRNIRPVKCWYAIETTSAAIHYHTSPWSMITSSQEAKSDRLNQLSPPRLF